MSRGQDVRDFIKLCREIIKDKDYERLPDLLNDLESYYQYYGDVEDID
jgi:hypothetical protein